MANKKRYTFLEKEHPEGGVLAAKLALVSLALLILDVFVSFLYQGSAGRFTGAIAFTGMLLSLYGLWSGMRSFSEKDASPVYPVTGSIGSGIMLIVYLALFLAGIG